MTSVSMFVFTISVLMTAGCAIFSFFGAFGKVAFGLPFESECGGLKAVGSQYDKRQIKIEHVPKYVSESLFERKASAQNS